MLQHKKLTSKRTELRKYVDHDTHTSYSQGTLYQFEFLSRTPWNKMRVISTEIRTQNKRV